MTTTPVRAVVDRCSCCIDGITYRFSLRWAAVEKNCDPALARHLLRIEAVASSQREDAPAILHVCVGAAELAELPLLLEDALHEHLAACTTRPVAGSLGAARCDRPDEGQQAAHWMD
jgi:hypothetical protein